MGYNKEETLQEELINIVENYQEDFGKIVVLCKDKIQVKILQEQLGKALKAQYILSDDAILKDGVTVMPSYMAKGLEYDAVVVYDASHKNYNNVFDKQLLYIACSRALHRLAILYLGECTKFLT